MDNHLVKQILSTVAYYDVMDYPMTNFEIWKYLVRINNAEKINLISFWEVTMALENEALKKIITEKNGFHFLKGREKLVELRIKRNKISVRKIKKLCPYSRWIALVPFVRGIAASGRLAMKNAEEGSDWDLKIIIKKGKIFTGRFLVTILVHFLGKRRHGKKIKDRVCLNHFIAQGSEVAMKDIYSAHEYSFLLPLFGSEEISRFQEANAWISDFKVNYFGEQAGNFISEPSHTAIFFKKILEAIFSFNGIEYILKKIQTYKIQHNPKTAQKGGAVIYTDEELAFWPNFENQGPKIFSQFQENLEELVYKK